MAITWTAEEIAERSSSSNRRGGGESETFREGEYREVEENLGAVSLVGVGEAETRRVRMKTRVMRTLLLLALLALSPSLLLSAQAANLCCGNPCQNRGVCSTVGFDRYECDCTRTGFYGDNCTTPELWTAVKMALKPSPESVHHLLTHFPGAWRLVNGVPFLRDAIMRYVLMSRSTLVPSPPTYNARYGYKSWESYSNVSYFTRVLPPVPEDCPTPMGVAGKAQLPDAQELAERFFRRRRFMPDPQGSNLMFAFFAQHFTHQFFKTDFKKGPEFTRALGHGVDLSHVYGDSLETQHQLRLFKDGKLKFQVIDGQVYPPSVEEARVAMMYPEHVPARARFAVGHESFGLVPGLMMFSTLWLREHNRVCAILREDHPEWDDERLFQTARLVLIGQTIKIVIEDYVQHLSGYHFRLKFDPELLFRENFQYRNRIAAEFNHLYHWHPLMPDAFALQGRVVRYPQFLFNNSVLLEHGVEGLVDSFARQQAGRIGGGKNIHSSVLRVAVAGIKHSRQMRFQSFNAYRRRFGLKSYRSFEDVTGETEMAAELREMYGDVDALELYPGLILERPRPGAIFGETMVEMGAPFSLKGLMGNPICSPEYWKPSTFGGARAFELVNTASLRGLVCRNIPGPCPEHVSFRVPGELGPDGQWQLGEAQQGATMASDAGEKANFYWSSGEEDEGTPGAEGHGVGDPDDQGDPDALQVPEEDINLEGSAVHTGPKGVITDWRRYKVLESVEKEDDPADEKRKLMKQMSVSCRPLTAEERRRADIQEQLRRKLSIRESVLVAEQEDEAFLRRYRQKRMEEMRRRLSFGPRFGSCQGLESGEEFLAAIECEARTNTLVLVHVYEDEVSGCVALNSCLECLAMMYPLAKFCRIRATDTGASERFPAEVLPAILVYRAGELIANFVRLSTLLGTQCLAQEAEAFLNAYSLLPEKETAGAGDDEDEEEREGMSRGHVQGEEGEEGGEEEDQGLMGEEPDD
ncbi:unnamed protein product, partial [Lampetra fluviatilis]